MTRGGRGASPDRRETRHAAKFYNLETLSGDFYLDGKSHEAEKRVQNKNV